MNVLKILIKMLLEDQPKSIGYRKIQTKKLFLHHSNDMKFNGKISNNGSINPKFFNKKTVIFS